jgi:RNA polymerase sigma-70 factor, ECF subfamily
VSGAERADIEGLYRQHRAGLIRLVQRELRDRQDAEDVVQTAFLDAQRALKRGTIPQNPRAWLAAIALNAARRLWHRQLNADALEEYAGQEASRLPEIKAALADLSKNEQAAVLYRDLLGLSYAEIAEQMGITVSAVTMLLHRARSRLRRVLGSTVGGVQLWGWLRSSVWPGTAAKAAGVVVVAGGLTTAGIVAGGRAARETAPTAGSSQAVAVEEPLEPAATMPLAPLRSRATRVNGVDHRPSIGPARAGSVQTEQSAIRASPETAATTPETPSHRTVLPAGPTAALGNVPIGSAAIPNVPTLSPPLPPLQSPPLPTSTAPTAPPVTTSLRTPAATATVNLP